MIVFLIINNTKVIVAILTYATTKKTLTIPYKIKNPKNISLLTILRFLLSIKLKKNNYIEKNKLQTLISLCRKSLFILTIKGNISKNIIGIVNKANLFLLILLYKINSILTK